jgi:hypothetical protein
MTYRRYPLKKSTKKAPEGLGLPGFLCVYLLALSSEELSVSTIAVSSSGSISTPVKNGQELLCVFALSPVLRS